MSNIKAKIGKHAVVLGASMAGLLAARSLSDFFDTVTVVERDPLPDTGAARRGVPQGRHLHALLARGAQAIEEMFPGVLDEMVLDGAAVLRWPGPVAAVLRRGRAPDGAQRQRPLV